MSGQGLWPGGAKAAISITMDNLGEAQEVFNGTWPEDQPFGTHTSVRSELPRMLDLLDRHSVKATYFAESWSLDVYPEVIKDLQARGHEVACHGYQHEPWGADLPAKEANYLFIRCNETAKDNGIEYAGFRPPGGSVNAETAKLLKSFGYRYISPLGEFGVNDNGVVTLPFEWRAVDAFYYMEKDKFSEIRKAHGETEEALTPDDFKAFLMRKIDEVVDKGGYMSILFHPFLTTTDERLAVMEEVVSRVRADPEIYCSPCRDVARWVQESADPAIFGTSRD